MCKTTVENVLFIGLKCGPGCPLSPWLFNVFLDMVAREARAQFKGGVCRDNCKMQLLIYADDTVLLAEMKEDLQHNVREFS